MNKLLYLTVIVNLFLLTSCEEVVELDLNTAAPRLVIDATIDWEKGTPGNIQTIRIHKTTGFYSTEIPAVSGAQVTVENSQGVQFEFPEVEPGVYTCTDFVPVLNETYTLRAIIEGELFTATETLRAVPEITRIEQGNEGGFGGDNIEVKFFFNDLVNESNFYLASYRTPIFPFPEFDPIEDRFFENNELFAFYSDGDLESGMTIEFALHGISQNYFNYMRILLGQTSGGGGSPFQTPPVTVRGNVVNQTNFNNFALGYFRVTEKVSLSYIVE